tara:strand:- start:321 stop:743 length:423 start_codon:yes stop_codon:yes gene_type:complete
MFFGNQTEQTRQYFYDAWHKFQKKEVLSPLEKQLVAVISDHPEYHELLKNPQKKHQDYYPELGQSNPFLHMGFHLALREQIQTDRPGGIRSIYKKLEKKYGQLETEHRMMEPLAEALWLAQKNQCMPDETRYLHALQCIN